MEQNQNLNQEVNRDPEGSQNNYYYQVERPAQPMNDGMNYQQNGYGNVPPYNYQGGAAYSQGNYAPYGYPQAQVQRVPEEISMWKYLGLMWVMVIPVVGFILMVVWAFSDEQINRRNYARAILLNMVISVVIGFFTWLIMFSFFLSLAEQMQRYY